MEDSITGTLIAEPNGRVTKSSGELSNVQLQGDIVKTAIRMLEASNTIIRGTAADNQFHKLNAFDREVVNHMMNGSASSGYLDKFKLRVSSYDKRFMLPSTSFAFIIRYTDYDKTTERKQPLRDAILMSKNMLNSTISLSNAIKKYPTCLDETKLRLVQKQVNVIDKVPINIATQIDTLYLSNNQIASLSNITQFANLLHLSLSNNAIKEISQLQELRCLPNLESLNLQGNAVAKHPIYRALILTALPNLTVHDGRNVSKEERIAAEIQVKKQNAIFDLMLVNYIEIQKLNYISKKLDIHGELSRGTSKILQIRYNNPIAFSRMSFNLPLMRRVIDLQSHLPDHVKNIMIDNLMTDVLTLYYQNIEQQEAGITQAITEACYEQAFSALLMKQQHLIASLTHENVNKVNSLTELQEKIETNYREQSRHMSPEAAQLRARSSDDDINYNQDALYRQKELRAAAHAANSVQAPSRQSKKHSKSPPQKLVFRKKSPENNNTKSASPTSPQQQQQQQQQQLKQNSASSNYQNILHKQNKQQDDMCCRPLMNLSNEEINDFKSTMLLKSPYRRTNYQLSQQVDSMQDTISTQERRIQDLSASLDEQNPNQPKPEELPRYLSAVSDDPANTLASNYKENIERIREINQEDEEYVERSKRDQSASEAVASADIPHWVTSELSQLRGEINGLMSSNLKLQEQSRQKEEAEQKTVFQQNEMIAFLQAELNRREQLESIAETFRDLHRKRSVFNSLIDAVAVEKQIKLFREEHSRVNVPEYFAAWYRKTRQNRDARAEAKRYRQELMQRHLRQWLSNVRFTQNLNEMMNEKKQRLLFRLFVELKQNCRKRQINQAKVQSAVVFYQKLAKVKSFKVLKQTMQSSRIPPSEMRRLDGIADCYSEHRIRAKGFDGWREYFNTIAQPVKQKVSEMVSARNQRTLVGVFARLKAMRMNAKEMARRANNYVSFQSKRRRHVLFKKWKAMAAATKTKLVQLNRFVVISALKNAFGQWQTAKKEVTVQKKYILIAVNHVRRQLQLKYFRVLKNKRSKAAVEKKAVAIITKANQSRNIRQVFQLWLSSARPAYTATCQSKLRCVRNLKSMLLAWRKVIEWKAKKAINQVALEAHVLKRKTRLNADVFRRMRGYYLKKRKVRVALTNYAESRKFKEYREFLLRLACIEKADLKAQVVDRAKALNSQEMIAYQAMNEAKEAEAERDNCVEELMKLKETVFEQKMIIEEYQHAQVKFNASVRSIERQERLFEEERASFERRLDEMQQLMDEMQQKHEQELLEKEKSIEKLTAENRQAAKGIKVLENELQFKQQTLVETERALMHRGDQSNGLVRETEKKLQNSIEMAAVFRSKIEEQQVEIDDLKDQLYSQSIDVSDLKDKLQASVDLIKETTSMYDSKIADFTTIVEAKQQQIVSLQFANERQDIQIAQLNALNHRPLSSSGEFSQQPISWQQQQQEHIYQQDQLEQDEDYRDDDDDQEYAYNFKEEQLKAERELVEQRKTLEVRMAQLNSSLHQIQQDEKFQRYMTSPVHDPIRSHQNLQQHPRILFSDSSVSQLSSVCSDQKVFLPDRNSRMTLPPARDVPIREIAPIGGTPSSIISEYLNK